MARQPVPISSPPQPSPAEGRAAFNRWAASFRRGVGRHRSDAPASPRVREPEVRPRAPESVVVTVLDRPLSADDLVSGGEWPTIATDRHLTPAVAARLLDLVRSGVPAASSAVLAGVPAARFRRWCRLETEPHVALRRLLDIADAFAEHSALRALRVSRDPKAALLYLSRRWPDRWSRRGERRAAQQAEMVAALTRSAARAARSAALSARMRRTRPWEFRTNVRAAQARRAAERPDPMP
jgi:hypothetical protein